MLRMRAHMMVNRQASQSGIAKDCVMPSQTFGWSPRLLLTWETRTACCVMDSRGKRVQCQQGVISYRHIITALWHVISQTQKWDFRYDDLIFQSSYQSIWYSFVISRETNAQEKDCKHRSCPTAAEILEATCICTSVSRILPCMHSDYFPFKKNSFDHVLEESSKNASPV